MSGYIDLDRTGFGPFDDVIYLIEEAGRAYHHTSQWIDDGWNGEKPYIDQINEHIAFAANAYESLRQQIAEKDADIAFLNRQRDAIQTLATHWSNKHDEVLQQLAASQLQNTQLRELIDKANGKLLAATMCHPNAVEVLVEEAYQVTTKALALPQDTSALEAIKAEVAAKAGEVMRDQACRMTPDLTVVDLAQVRRAIRALPGVTMEDLK